MPKQNRTENQFCVCVCVAFLQMRWVCGWENSKLFHMFTQTFFQGLSALCKSISEAFLLLDLGALTNFVMHVFAQKRKCININILSLITQNSFSVPHHKQTNKKINKIQLKQPASVGGRGEQLHHHPRHHALLQPQTLTDIFFLTLCLNPVKVNGITLSKQQSA